MVLDLCSLRNFHTRTVELILMALSEVFTQTIILHEKKCVQGCERVFIIGLLHGPKNMKIRTKGHDYVLISQRSH
jgi:hypothetical protein